MCCQSGFDQQLEDFAMIIHNQRLNHLALRIIAIGAFLIASFTFDTGPLVFEDDRPLNITWQQALLGVDIVVCNVGNIQLQSLQARLTGFNFQVGQKPINVDEGLKKPNIKSVLDAGECTSVSITAVAGTIPNPNTYGGLLVILSPNAGIIRREINVRVVSAETAIAEGASGKLSFEDPNSLTLTVAQAKNGENVNVCNDGNAQLNSLKASFVGFKFQEHKTPIKASDVFTSLSMSSWLEAGTCTSVGIHLNSAIDPDPGVYKGVILISAVKDDGTTDRISLNVTIESQAPKTTMDKLILTATRNGPFFRDVHLDIGFLPLQPTIGRDTSTPASEGNLIGTIDYEGRLGSVYVNGPVDTQGEIYTLPIRINGLKDVGTYSGKLDLSGLGNTEQTVPIEVKVTDHIGWAIAAIFVGLALALITMFIMQRWRYELELNRRRNVLKKNYDDAKRIFDSLSEDFVFKNYELDDENIIKYQTDFDNAFKVYKSSYLFFFDTNSEEFKNLIKSLETAENDAKVFGNPENQKSLFNQSLQSLHVSLKSFRDFLNKQFPHSQIRRPNFVQFAADLLNGKHLKVGQAEKIKTKADEYVDMIIQWKNMAAKIRSYRAWGMKLLEKEIELSKTLEPMTIGDREILRQALGRVEEASNELLDATETSDLTRLGSAEDLKGAYNYLSYLGGRYKVWVERADEITVIKHFFLFHRLQSNQEMFQEENWFLSNPLYISPEVVAVIQQATRWLSDAFILILGTILALSTGLTLLYFGKTFGKWEDYLAAILLALATPTLVKFLTDALKQFGIPLKS